VGFYVTTNGKTYLDCATLPGEDGCLAFMAVEIVFTISKLSAENFSKTSQKLGITLVSIAVPFVCLPLTYPDGERASRIKFESILCLWFKHPVFGIGTTWIIG